MKRHLTINFINNTIEVSTSFIKKARVYRSYAYDMLTEVQRQHPHFALQILPPKKKTPPVITYNFMRQYIIAHDESGEMLCELENVIERCRNILVVKKWFVMQYPAFEACKSKEEWLLVA
jgi:hypothetical protein